MSLDHNQLTVFNLAHELVLSVYDLTRSFPREERFRLADQLRRAALSVPANIAEGCGRGGDREFRHFLSIAHGSATELGYLLRVAEELKLLDGAVATPCRKRADHLIRALQKLRTARQNVQHSTVRAAGSTTSRSS